MYIRFIAWLLYKNALHGKRLSSVVDTPGNWEKKLNVSIRSHPDVFATLYRDLALYALLHAKREV